MNYYLFCTINLLLSALPVIAAIMNVKLLDKGSIIIYALLILCFVTECTAVYAAFKYRNNLPVYNVSNILQSFMIALYFNHIIKFFRKHNIGIYIGVFSVVAGIIDMLFIESVKTYNSNFFLFQTILIVIFCAILCYQFLSAPFIKFGNNPHFWFVTLILSFSVLNYFSLSLYDFFTDRLKNYKIIIDNSVTILSGLTNIGFMFVFIFYRKMKNNAR